MKVEGLSDMLTDICKFEYKKQTGQWLSHRHTCCTTTRPHLMAKSGQGVVSSGLAQGEGLF